VYRGGKKKITESRDILWGILGGGVSEERGGG